MKLYLHINFEIIINLDIGLTYKSREDLDTPLKMLYGVFEHYLK